MTPLKTFLLLIGGAAVALTVGLAVRSAVADPSTVLEATVVSIDRAQTKRTYPSVDHGSSKSAKDDKKGTTAWRVVEETGNCCENYVTTSREGRLFDFGGTYVNFSDDRGLTWKQVRPLTPLQNGEGTIAVAPNGDIIGIGWDPYSGDHLQAYKYEAFSGKWFYNELPLHTPFYDREWVTVLPGPFSVDGRTVPYISFVKGGSPSKELWMWSSDGLNYLEASSKFVDATQNGTVSTWLTTKADSSFDWIQPNSETGLTPLGAGSGLAAPDLQLPSAGVPGRAESFSGSVAAPCDIDKGPFAVAAGEADSINVGVVAENAANDSVVLLKYNGNTVVRQDLLTSPELLTYDPPGTVPAGAYTVQVCDFAGTGAWLPPAGYSGVLTLNAASLVPGPGSPWSVLDPATVTWKGFTFADGTVPQGRFQVDSAGRLHNVLDRETSFVYRISPDGGKTWKSTTIGLPAGMKIEQWDFRANKATGFGAVVIRAQKDDGNDQDLAYRFDIKSNTPLLKRSYSVGLGDAGSTAGVQSDVRMDFQTVTILPGGAIAVSILDSTTNQQPALAIELESSYK
jgi:hypothetical protein